MCNIPAVCNTFVIVASLARHSPHSVKHAASTVAHAMVKPCMVIMPNAAAAAQTHIPALMQQWMQGLNAQRLVCEDIIKSSFLSCPNGTLTLLRAR